MKYWIMILTMDNIFIFKNIRKIKLNYLILIRESQYCLNNFDMPLFLRIYFKKNNQITIRIKRII